jgi:iron complex outermembrane receptor protein
MMGKALWLGASALALAWSNSAVAQDDPPSDGADEEDGVIVVTAQRRSENLMTTAVSASVISGSTLEEKGVVNVDALQFATPSVVVNNFGQGNDFNVRGIGKAEHNTQTTTGVITYRDGVPTFPGYVQGEPYYDIANIQVLRGPQGTIVGQNATGGAVFVNTVDPVINGGVHGYFQAQAGNYNDFGAQFGINLPLGDTVAMRISGFGERRGGFYDITNNGAPYTGNNGDLRMYTGRLSLLWQPTDQLSFLSKTDVGHLDFGAYPASPYWTQFENWPYGSSTPNPYASDLFEITANAPSRARDKFVRSILKIEYEFDSGVRFRSVSSYQKANTVYGADLDGTDSTFPYPSATPPAIRDWYFFDDVNERQITQELNLISADDQRFTWLLGASGVWNKYFFKEPYQFIIDTNYPMASSNPLKPFYVYALQGTNPTKSLAVFGQLGFNITDNLKLEVGGRYTDSQSTNHVDVIQYGTPILAEQTTKSENFSYKVSLGYKASEDHYLYGFVATGFRPGGLNVPVGLGLPAPFKQEEVTSFEAGWKANFAGGNIRTTVNGFYNNYKNFQVTIGYPTFPTFGIELNVEDTTKIYGFEAEAEFHFGGFSLDAGINVLNSSLGEFYATDPRAASVQPCDPNTGPGGGTCLALKGRDQTYAPDLTFNIGAQYVFDIDDDDSITPRVNFGHIAEQWATLFENEARGDLIEARNILNAQLEWRHGMWAVTAYGTNLTNQHYPGALNSGLYFAGPPRQYGVKVLKTF